MFRGIKTGIGLLEKKSLSMTVLAASLVLAPVCAQANVMDQLFTVFNSTFFCGDVKQNATNLLRDAIKSADKQKMIDLLNCGASPDLLEEAANTKNDEIIKILVNRGARLDNATAISIFNNSVRELNVDLVKVFADNGYRIQKGYKSTAIEGFNTLGYDDPGKVLLDKELYWKNGELRSQGLLGLSEEDFRIRRLEITRNLLRAGLDLYGIDYNSSRSLSTFSHLSWAAKTGDAELVSLLISSGAPYFYKEDKTAASPLMMASNAEVFELLMNRYNREISNRDLEFTMRFAMGSALLVEAILNTNRVDVNRVFDLNEDIFIRANSYLTTALWNNLYRNDQWNGQTRLERAEEGLRIVRLLVSRGANTCLKSVNLLEGNGQQYTGTASQYFEDMIATRTHLSGDLISQYRAILKCN